MKLYDELASWFHLLTAPADYKEEAELYTRLIVEHTSGFTDGFESGDVSVWSNTVP